MEKYFNLAKNYLSDYIKINSSNPPCNIETALEFWKKIYEKEGIRYEIYEHPSGKKSICGFVIEDTDAQCVLLLNHMDVVPANADEWLHDPFSGEIYEEYIYGRGAIDMKGLAIIQLVASLYVRKECNKLRRNVCILSVPDEETGGFFGAQFVSNNYVKNINPCVVLDEGTFAIKGKKGVDFFVSYSQKKTLWLKVCAYGKNGHGASPTPDNANDILIKALTKICSHPYRDKNMNYKNISECKKFLFGMLYSNTISVTSLHSSSAPNVKPQYAEAALDCRLMHEMDVDTFMDYLKAEINDERIKLEVIKRTDKVAYSDTNHEIIHSIKRAVSKNVPEADVKIIVSPVGTDSKYFRDVGIESYGFFPIILNVDELDMMHGVNEKLSMANLSLALNVYVDVLYDFLK